MSVNELLLHKISNWVKNVIAAQTLVVKRWRTWYTVAERTTLSFIERKQDRRIANNNKKFIHVFWQARCDNFCSTNASQNIVKGVLQTCWNYITVMQAITYSLYLYILWQSFTYDKWNDTRLVFVAKFWII